jgi:hypothetical protein
MIVHVINKVFGGIQLIIIFTWMPIHRLDIDHIISIMDDDWLEHHPHAGPSTWQGSAQDPLVDRQWDRLQTRYTDVSIGIPAGVQCNIL